MPLPRTLHVPVMLCSAVLHLLNICMCCMCHQQIMPGYGCKLPLWSVQVVGAHHCTNIWHTMPHFPSVLAIRMSSSHPAQTAALCMLLLPLTHSDKQSVELFAEEGVTFLLHPLYASVTHFWLPNHFL
jgi:hypothetical protein